MSEGVGEGIDLKTLLFRWWDRMQETIWFLPAVCGVIAVGLALLAQWFDGPALDWHWPSILTDWQPRSPEGIRSVLTTVAGSMLGLAGVSFSITVVALSLASSQFGSRLLRNFTRDRRVHLVLGIQVGVFLYCLTMLGVLRVELNGDFNPPVIGLPLSLGLAMFGVGSFIYFVHHIADQIQASTVISRVSDELCAAIDRFFPQTLDEQESRSGTGYRDWPVVEIRARRSGYVQAFMIERLIGLARELDGVIEVLIHPGTFVIEKDVWMRVYSKEAVSDATRAHLAGCCLQGTRRTMEQDFEFAIHQLVEVAVRALSPGINDPITAMNCIDRLIAAYARIAERQMPRSEHFDTEGKFRLQLREVNFNSVFDAGLIQIRQNARTSPAVSIRMLDALIQLVSHIQTQSALECIECHGSSVARGAMDAAHEQMDQETIEGRWQDLTRALADRKDVLSQSVPPS